MAAASTIQSVKARQIFDSRGNPTIEVDVCCSDGTFARAAVPSGASTDVYEALELRDGGSDYLGRGVSKAVSNVNSIIAPALIGKDPTAQTELDNFMVQQLPLITLDAASSSFPPSYSIPLWRRL
ncbi:enolase [Hordeum vulgare]|nr:enolase [Hordeum vulgare]